MKNVSIVCAVLLSTIISAQSRWALGFNFHAGAQIGFTEPLFDTQQYTYSPRYSSAFSVRTEYLLYSKLSLIGGLSFFQDRQTKTSIVTFAPYSGPLRSDFFGPFLGVEYKLIEFEKMKVFASAGYGYLLLYGQKNNLGYTSALRLNLKDAERHMIQGRVGIEYPFSQNTLGSGWSVKFEVLAIHMASRFKHQGSRYTYFHLMGGLGLCYNL